MRSRGGQRKHSLETAERIFRMVDSGIPITKAANTLKLPYGTAYRLLDEEEGRQKRRAKRGTLVVTKAGGGNDGASSRGGKKAQANKRLGYAESHAEHLARLAPLLESVTREHARRSA